MNPRPTHFSTVPEPPQSVLPVSSVNDGHIHPLPPPAVAHKTVLQPAASTLDHARLAAARPASCAAAVSHSPATLPCWCGMLFANTAALCVQCTILTPLTPTAHAASFRPTCHRPQLQHFTDERAPPSPQTTTPTVWACSDAARPIAPLSPAHMLSHRGRLGATSPAMNSQLVVGPLGALLRALPTPTPVPLFATIATALFFCCSRARASTSCSCPTTASAHAGGGCKPTPPSPTHPTARPFSGCVPSSAAAPAGAGPDSKVLPQLAAATGLRAAARPPWRGEVFVASPTLFVWCGGRPARAVPPPPRRLVTHRPFAGRLRRFPQPTRTPPPWNPLQNWL